MIGVVDQLITEELRNAAGTPQKFQLLDFLGVGLGTWFIVETLRRRDPSYVNVGLGAIMIYIHSQRFLVAPQEVRTP